MIEEYIANSQFQDALDLLTDLDDETVRYQRLVCLYGLGQYQQAKNEGMLAKIKASNTYYDVVSIYLATLKELEEFEEAIDIVVEELSMPYIPYEYESVFNAAYDELLLAKKEANEEINPSYAPMVLNQEVGEAILSLLSEVIEDENPSLYNLCFQFLNFYLYLIYPKYIDEFEYRAIAGAIHYYLASMQYIDVELEDMELFYNCDKEEILEKLEEIKQIEY